MQKPDKKLRHKPALHLPIGENKEINSGFGTAKALFYLVRRGFLIIYLFIQFKRKAMKTLKIETFDIDTKHPQTPDHRLVGFINKNRIPKEDVLKIIFDNGSYILFYYS
jgi:hypothetical protein